jgi:hypothetical protein
LFKTLIYVCCVMCVLLYSFLTNRAVAWKLGSWPSFWFGRARTTRHLWYFDLDDASTKIIFKFSATT